MTSRLFIWMVLALLAPAVSAQEPPPPGPGPALKAPVRPTVSTDLRAEYLAGEPIVIRFEVLNTGAEPASFPDLAARPWLVRFSLTGPDGKTIQRFNTPPKSDLPRRWDLGPRARRQTLLQIPSSGGLAPGRWQVEIRILDPQGEIALPAHSFHVAKPRPVAGSLVHDELGLERTGHHALWLHKARDGYDLYLHHSQGSRPERMVGDYHLAHLDTRVDPVLSHSRPQERWGRFFYWQQDARTLAFGQLDGQQLRGRIRTLQVPWPGVELIARGSTDADGGLHVPLWVPNPKGTGGELRVASVRGQGNARFRSVVRLPRRPAYVESTVDAAGALRLLVSHDGFLDLYTVVPGNDLPGVGTRLPVERAPAVARFGYLPDQAETPGGLAILGLTPTPEGLVGRWFGLGGRTVHTYPPVRPPPGAELVALRPRGLSPYAAIYHPTEGPAVLVLPGRPARTLQGRPDGVLLTDGGEALWLRALAGGGSPLVTRKLMTSDG